MRFFVLTLLFSIHHLCFTQNLTGKFKGVIYQKNTDPLKGIYYTFDIPMKNSSVLMRTETANGKNVSLKKANFNFIGKDNIEITETIITQKSRSNTLAWCRNKISLHYNEMTGYWTGFYLSTDCINQTGEVIFFRTDEHWIPDVNITNSLATTSATIQGFKDGLPAPDIIELDRKNFKFTPIYFEFDQANIKEEYKEYLTKMGQLVKGHSDIRIRVIGHTDAVGSDQYNDGLSYRRAKAIETFFNSMGVPAHRLVFGFKGEKLPIATNNSAEGRQLNRRVDFEFIYE